MTESNNPLSWVPAVSSYHATRKLDAETVRAIRREYKDGWCQTVLAEKYGVSQSNIHHIVMYKTWVHVTDE